MSQARTGGRPSPEVFRRRRIVVASAAGALVLTIVLLTAFVWPGFAREEPTPQATVTAPVPTPTLSPSGRPKDQTAFVEAQPDAVLALALREVTEDSSWEDDADAVEAWQLVYADADGEGATTVQVHVGQWEDADDATGAYEALVKAAGEPTGEGEVAVDGETTGAYVVTPGSTAGSGVVTWRNGTAVLQATGPADVIEDFYSAYPL